MSDSVNLKITNCQKCPNFGSQRYHTGDSFEYVEEWKCKASAGKRIALQGWSDATPKIPQWCPLRNEK